MAVVLSAFMNNLVGKLMDFAAEEMSTLLGVAEEVKKLQTMLAGLGGFLRDAEQMKNTGNNSRTITLLKELKDVMYDADDIIETCMMEGGKLLVFSDPFNMFSSCFRCLKYRHELGADIKRLNDKIDEIIKYNQIAATFASADPAGHNHQKVVSFGTSPIQGIASIVGSQIEEAAESLISSILENGDHKATCRIFAITGMGGIGKTTLARKVYNDERITRSYHDPNDTNVQTSNLSSRRIWLHVPKNYNPTELLKEMVRNLGGSDDGVKSIGELDPKLSLQLPESLFLVLDDVWVADVWKELLINPMQHRGTKCSVLVTTRDEGVAKSLKASHIHRVQRMDKHSCWELLCQEVFKDGEKDEIFSLLKIGSKIVDKCDGLPLAVKAIAGVLIQKEKSILEWDKVLRDEIWCMKEINGDVPKALYLSYEDLSPALKQCFIYFSFISQSGEEMNMTDVVACLVDEGFVLPNGHGRKSMEEVAEDWYKELMHRNLLEPHPDYPDGDGCTMHDLLQSLGQSLMEGEATCNEVASLDNDAKWYWRNIEAP